MQIVTTNTVKTSSAAFFALIKNPLLFRWFLLKNLPAAYFSGVRVKSVKEEQAVVAVPYKWFTRNPFRSTYFACLSMAAEMSTGVLAMANVYKSSPKVSIIVTAIEGKFYKKATGPVHFICEEGMAIRQAIETAIATSEPQMIRALSTGFSRQNERVAEFWVTWSFKTRLKN
jgi:hypothetical protein